MRYHKGRYEKRPKHRVNWKQSIVNAVLSLLVGIILQILSKVFK